jgi:hypothetical protein
MATPTQQENDLAKLGAPASCTNKIPEPGPRRSSAHQTRQARATTPQLQQSQNR